MKTTAPAKLFLVLLAVMLGLGFSAQAEQQTTSTTTTTTSAAPHHRHHHHHYHNQQQQVQPRQ